MRITVIFWILAKIISYKAWISDRSFPLVPPFHFLHLPGGFHLLFYIISLACLLILIATPFRYTIVIICFINESASCLLDQNRWQPWEYQYLFIFLIFILNKKKPGHIIPAVIFILSAIYFYSGISKLSPQFITRVWDNLILLRVFKINEGNSYHQIMRSAGYLIPFIEIVAGFLLLYDKTRKSACYVMIGMHLFNLFFLGPLGLNYNKVIWPWNMAMILYLFIIIRQPVFSFSWFTLIKKENVLIFLCWGILPLLNYIGWWDHYLSSNLYTGRTKNLFVCVSNSNAHPSPLTPYFNSNLEGLCNEGNMIDITKWSMQELKVPCYPEERVFREICLKLKKQYPYLNLNFFITGQGTYTVIQY